MNDFEQPIPLTNQLVGSSVKQHVVNKLTRSLTAGEIAMCKTIWRYPNDIDYSGVKISRMPNIPFTDAITPFNGIYFSVNLYSDDFSALQIKRGDPDKSAFRRGVFIHEMHHVFQWQHGVNKIAHNNWAYAATVGTKRTRNSLYDFSASRVHNFTDFNFEAQAQIILTYYCMTQQQYEGLYSDDEAYLRRNNYFENVIKIVEPFIQDPNKNFKWDPNLGLGKLRGLSE